VVALVGVEVRGADQYVAAVLRRDREVPPRYVDRARRRDEFDVPGTGRPHDRHAFGGHRDRAVGPLDDLEEAANPGRGVEHLGDLHRPGPDPGVAPAVGEVGRDLQRALGQHVAAQRGRSGVAAAPARPPSYPSLGGVDRGGPEGRLQPPTYLGRLYPKGPQRGGGVEPGVDRRADALQLGAGGAQIEARGLEQSGRPARAMPEETEQHVLVGARQGWRSSRASRWASRITSRLSGVSRVQTPPVPSSPMAAASSRGRSPPHEGCSCCLPRTRSPCL
jgi:hypothetical protein